MLILNNIRSNRVPLFVGTDFVPRVNVLLGMSDAGRPVSSILRDAMAFEKSGADCLQDVSTAGDIDGFRLRMSAESSVPVGSVLAYGFCLNAMKYRRLSRANMRELVLHEVQRDAECGYDFITIHAVVRRLAGRRGQIMPPPSRGGFLLRQVMNRFNVDNPIMDCLDAILRICAKYRIVVGLGSERRVGSIVDFRLSDARVELERQALIIRRAMELHVEVFLEGCGHIPCNKMREYVSLARQVCGDVEVTALGPLLTDIALGLDHVSGAMGFWAGASCGMSFLSMVTGGEHHALPNRETTLQALASYRVARHLAALDRGLTPAADQAISSLRQQRSWHAMVPWALSAEARRSVSGKKDGTPCSICHYACPMGVASHNRGIGPDAIYPSCEPFLRRYPIKIQNLWLSAVQSLMTCRVESLITFGSMVSGEFVLNLSRGHWRAVSDFEFTALVSEEYLKSERLRIRSSVIAFNDRVARKHLGFNVNVMISTEMEFRTRATRNRVLWNALNSTGVVVAGHQVLPISQRPRVCVSELEDACRFFIDILEETLIQLDSRIVQGKRDWLLYLAYLLSRFMCKALWVNCLRAGFWPRNSVDALDRLSGLLPVVLRQIHARALTLRTTHSPGELRRSIAQLSADCIYVISEHVRAFAQGNVVPRTMAHMTRTAKEIDQFLKLLSVGDGAPTRQAEARRRQVAVVLLENRREHYDYYKRIYGCLFDV